MGDTLSVPAVHILALADRIGHHPGCPAILGKEHQCNCWVSELRALVDADKTKDDLLGPEPSFGVPPWTSGDTLVDDDAAPVAVPDAETAWAEWFKQEWDTCDIDDDAHQEMKRTTQAAFIAGFAAASSVWREQLATASTDVITAELVGCATHERLIVQLKQQAQVDTDGLNKLKADLDAALARNAELEGDSTFHSDECMDAHMLPCRCGADGRRARKAEAELDNLRETLAQKIEAERDNEAYRKTHRYGMTVAAQVVRGSDDEAENTCTCGESVPTVTTPGPCYWAENAPGVQSQVHCPPPARVAR